MLLQCLLTLLVVLICGAALAALAVIISWQESAPSAAVRRQRLMGVVPATGLLLLVLLAGVFSVMMLWSAQGADLLAAL